MEDRCSKEEARGGAAICLVSFGTIGLIMLWILASLTLDVALCTWDGSASDSNSACCGCDIFVVWLPDTSYSSIMAILSLQLDRKQNVEAVRSNSNSMLRRRRRRITWCSIEIHIYICIHITLILGSGDGKEEYWVPGHCIHGDRFRTCSYWEELVVAILIGSQARRLEPSKGAVGNRWRQTLVVNVDGIVIRGVGIHHSIPTHPHFHVASINSLLFSWADRFLLAMGADEWVKWGEKPCSSSSSLSLYRSLSPHEDA